MSMPDSLTEKIDDTILLIKKVWAKVRNGHPFIAFSTGKDSLLVAALVYEAVAPEKPICLYSHHNFEFDCNIEYLSTIQNYFDVRVVHPYLSYFELMERGIGFLTLKDPWCVPMLVGTGVLDWLKNNGAKNPESCFMFRGMSGTEYSHKFHTTIEKYDRLKLPTMNPILKFRKDEILQTLDERYHLPLNPIYKHMDRTYCICCYTSDEKRQKYSGKHHPIVCQKYYQQIETLLFESGLIDKSSLDTQYKTREEKLDKHGFVHWNRSKYQNKLGAIKTKLASGAIVYHIQDSSLINVKHLAPVEGNWSIKGNTITFWNLSESITDCVVKRMINCLDCGFCVVQCFQSRNFNRQEKTMELTNCSKCGQCLNLSYCMGWKHRFWRRIIVENRTDDRTTSTKNIF